MLSEFRRASSLPSAHGMALYSKMPSVRARWITDGHPSAPAFMAFPIMPPYPARGCGLPGRVAQGIPGLRLGPRTGLIRRHNVCSGIRYGGF